MNSSHRCNNTCKLWCCLQDSKKRWVEYLKKSCVPEICPSSLESIAPSTTLRLNVHYLWASSMSHLVAVLLRPLFPKAYDVYVLFPKVDMFHLCILIEQTKTPKISIGRQMIIIPYQLQCRILVMQEEIKKCVMLFILVKQGEQPLKTYAWGRRQCKSCFFSRGSLNKHRDSGHKGATA